MSSASASGSEPQLPQKPITVYRQDYKPTPYSVPTIHLAFQLDANRTLLEARSEIVVKEFPADSSKQFDLVLNGEENLSLLSVAINGTALKVDEDYKIDSVHEQTLTVFYKTVARLVAGLEDPKSPFWTAETSSRTFTLNCTVESNPSTNTALSGLYKSDDMLTTQCEAMGFRRIAFHYDRPDVLSVYTVRLEADKQLYPVLLSNGNCISQEEQLPGNRHSAVWHDPFPKPSYLFAIVAGDLGSIHSTYTTTSGRVVKLGIYSDKFNADKLDFAMYSIKESMKWDEDTFGLEYDLDVFNIVAVTNFNMGAMENKGLNIFLASLVIANKDITTDDYYSAILGVIGHEYFHNYTGNKVTCRDWFQLTLKEGLTVFRDQWFTSDHSSFAVKRINDVKTLYNAQFPEDQGPMSHPIRPDSYISMDNFYTTTVYRKGAEIVRIYRTLYGFDGFKRGMKLYFQRHDGSAVTCSDFLAAMRDANLGQVLKSDNTSSIAISSLRDSTSFDINDMELWYSQSGTPVVHVEQKYDPATRRLTLFVRQEHLDTPNQPASSKKPVILPIVVGLIGKTSRQEILTSQTFVLTEASNELYFDNVTEEPVVSIFREFSAPIKLDFNQDDDDLAILMGFDTDGFNKWNAGQRLMKNIFVQLCTNLDSGLALPVELPAKFLTAIRNILQESISAMASGSAVDYNLTALAIQLPDYLPLIQSLVGSPNMDNVIGVRKFMECRIAINFSTEFNDLYQRTHPSRDKPFEFTPEEAGKRLLHNICLGFLNNTRTAESIQLALDQYYNSITFTERMGALGVLTRLNSGTETDPCAIALSHFWTTSCIGDNLMKSKWFSIQASADNENTIELARELVKHPDFTFTTPTTFRSVVTMLAMNVPSFHRKDGKGYTFLRDMIVEVDKYNPIVAGRITSFYSIYKTLDADRKVIIKQCLEHILAQPNLSKDTFENVTRILN